MSAPDPAPLTAFAEPPRASAPAAAASRWPLWAGAVLVLALAVLDSWLGWIWGGPLLVLLLALAAVVHSSVGELQWLWLRRGLQARDGQLRRLRVVPRPAPAPAWAPRHQLEAAIAYSVEETARSGAAVLSTVAVLYRSYDAAAPKQRGKRLKAGQPMKLWLDPESPHHPVAARDDAPLHAVVAACAGLAFIALAQVWYAGHFV